MYNIGVWNLSTQFLKEISVCISLDELGGCRHG
jgi:hypothetical protein